MRLATKYPQFFKKVAIPRAAELFGDLVVGEPQDLIDGKVSRPDILVSPVNLPTAQTLKLLSKFKCGHFIQTQRENFFSEIIISSLLLRQPQVFFGKDQTFLLHRFFEKNTKGQIRSRTWQFQSNSHKGNILKDLASFLEAHTTTSSFSMAAVQIADELITNALFHGPIDVNKNHIFCDLDRREDVEFPSDMIGQVIVYHDDHRLLIGCEDPWGSLSTSHLTKFLLDRYTDAKPLYQDFRAGLGVKLVIDQSSEFYTIVSPFHKTLIYCSFELSKSLRKIQSTPKHLHFSEVKS